MASCSNPIRLVRRKGDEKTIMQLWQRFGLAIGLCAAPITSSAAPFAQTVYQLTINGGGLGYMEREVILFSRIDFGGAQPTVWIAERRRNNQQLRETIADHQWIDGRTCSALATVLGDISTLPAMKFSEPAGAQPTGLAFDVPMTTLRGPPTLQSDEAISLARSEFKGPVSKWAHAARSKLTGCWTDAPPRVEGVEISPHLATAAKAEAYLR